MAVADQTWWVIYLDFKGLLTKLGYINKITKSCTQTTVMSFDFFQNWKKMKCNQDILVQSLGLILSNPNWKCDVTSPQPIKAHVIGQSLNESIVMSHYLIPTINRHQLTGLISFHNYNDILWLANQKPNTNYIASQVECLECRNSKSSRQKSNSFKCEYISFHTVYELETLRIYLYSPSLRTGKV